MNTNRLQLLRHAEVLPNYESLNRFLLRNYVNVAKDGEPFVMFYQDGDEVRMVLAIGNTNNEYGCEIIDFKSLESKIAELAEEVEELSDEVKDVVEAVETIKTELAQEIQDRIDADNAEAVAREEMDALLAKLCGFVMNERSGEFEYVHDVRDEIIGNAETLAEAIDLLSKFVQDNNITYTFEKSKSVRFTVEEDDKERKVKAEVILSKGDRDEDSHDDNILVKYEDGLAATIDLSYDEAKQALMFTRSCTETGKHKTSEITLPFKNISDAIAEVEDSIADEKAERIAKDTEFEAAIAEIIGHSNAGKDEISIYGVRNRVDAIAEDASEAADKALEDAKEYTDDAIAGADVAGAAERALEDAKTYADEKDESVMEELARETERAKAAEKRALIVEVKDGKGIDLTRSIDEDGTTLEAEAKLSGFNKNILSLKEDGLYAPEVQVEYDGVTNTITFKMGESETSYQLAGVTAVNDLRYDTESKNLIFSITDDKGDKKDVNVYLGDLVPSIMSGSTEESPIKINIEKDTDREGQFVATVTAELNNVWDKDIKADFHIDTTDAEGTIIATERLENVHQVLQHLLNRIAKAFEILAKLQNLKINGIKPYDEEHNGIMELKGSDIKVGGDDEHQNDTVDKAIEDLYDEIDKLASIEVKVRNGENNNYLSVVKSKDTEDEHDIYTLDAKTVRLADVDDDNTGIADAKDVKDAIDEAIEIAIANGVEINAEDDKYFAVDKVRDEEDGHFIYTVGPKIVSLEDASDDNTGVADANDVKKAIAAISVDGAEVVAGDGVNVASETAEDGHKIYTVSAKIDESSDEYITVGESGIKVSGIDDKIEGMKFEDSIDGVDVVVKVSQEDGIIDVAKRRLNGTVDNGADGKSVITFNITDTEITADFELIDCGEY